MERYISRLIFNFLLIQHWSNVFWGKKTERRDWDTPEGAQLHTEVFKLVWGEI